MNTLLFIIYTFVALVCLFQIIILTCEATRQKRQIEELIRDIQLLEGTQERFSEQLMKMNELNQRLNNLECQKVLRLKHQKECIKIGKGNSMTEIKAGNCYMCLKDIGGYDSFTKGKVYSSLYDNALINDNHIEVKVMPSDYFRIATNKEIKAQKGE